MSNNNEQPAIDVSSTALTVREDSPQQYGQGSMGGVVKFDARDRALAIEAIMNRAATVAEVMEKVMKPDIHYGTIPGTNDKKVLLKAGAEKLSAVFRLTPQFTVHQTDYQNFHREYRVTCRLSDGTEGVGTCTTLEEKYRYRKSGRKCPKCGKEQIIEGKAEYGGGWLCWAKKGGCGTKFAIADPAIAQQNPGKVEHQNPADYWNCVTPDTKVLTHDLRWVQAGDIKSGDLLIGVDEHRTTDYARNLAVGVATVGGYKRDILYRLTFEDGRQVCCNGEHQWLVKKIGLKGTEWVTTQDIHKELNKPKGRPRKWSVMSLCATWIEDISKDAGYIAGLLDADGTLGITQIGVSFAQTQNIVLGGLQSGLANRGYHLGIDKCKTEVELQATVDKKQVFAVRVLGGFAEQIRLLGTIRPPRLMERWLTRVAIAKRRLEGRGSGAGSPSRIASIEKIGEGDVVLLGTSCHTYIAEGLVCHNTCLKMAKKRAHVDAIITATATSDLLTQDLEEVQEMADQASAAIDGEPKKTSEPKKTATPRTKKTEKTQEPDNATTGLPEKESKRLFAWLDACKDAFVAKLEADEIMLPFAWAWCVQTGIILPNESLKSAQATKLFPGVNLNANVEANKPVVAEDFRKNIIAIETLGKAGQLDEVTTNSFLAVYKEPAATTSEKPIEVPRDRDVGWKLIPVPAWSKHSKVDGHKTFGDLPKAKLWWWVIKWAPTGYKDQPPKEEEIKLRKILDTVKEQYDFESNDAGSEPASRATEPTTPPPVEDDVPF